MSVVETSRFPAGIWRADRGKSHLGFSVAHATLGTFRGWFADYAVELVAGHEGTASLTGSVEARSVASGDDALDARLTSADLLDAERFPRLSFASTFLGRDAGRVELDGKLTVKDRTLLVAGLGSVVDVGPARLDLELTTAVDRRQFGLDWNLRLPGGVLATGNEVTIDVKLALLKHLSESD